MTSGGQQCVPHSAPNGFPEPSASSSLLVIHLVVHLVVASHFLSCCCRVVGSQGITTFPSTMTLTAGGNQAVLWGYRCNMADSGVLRCTSGWASVSCTTTGYKYMCMAPRLCGPEPPHSSPPPPPLAPPPAPYAGMPPVSNGLWAYQHGNSWDGTNGYWADYSGQGHHMYVTRGTLPDFVRGSETRCGKSFPYIYGPQTAGLQYLNMTWTTPDPPYTLFHVSR